MAHYAFTCPIVETIAATKHLMHADERDHWLGFASEEGRNAFFRDGYSAEAVNDMRDARAQLASTGQTSTLKSATVGAWDIPSVLAGLPVSAMRRATIPAPPLSIRVNIAPRTKATAQTIATQTARLANAVRAEILKGRAISLTVVSAHKILKNHGKYIAGDTTLLTVPVDASRDDELATALSMQFYRCALIRCNGVDPRKTGGIPVDGAINFGDNNTRMMSELNAILAA